MRLENNQMFPDEGKALKRKREEIWGLETTLLKGETKADFDEINIEEACRINAEQEVEEVEKYGLMSTPTPIPEY